MVPLVYAIGLGAMLFTALSYMAMAQAFPVAGSVYTYARNPAIDPRLPEAAAALELEDPVRSETGFGALVSREHCEKVMGYLESGDHEGAKRLYTSDSKAPHAGGLYLPPVIFDEVSSALRIAREEIFGPVLSVMTFRDEDEAIRLANENMYGLSAIIWTKHLGRAHRLATGIHPGRITVNATGTPVGDLSEGTPPVGGQKESGMSVEGGIEGLQAYTDQTAVQLFV
jgi:acyl-CoA reductase-like NAD-dependent aldehyde dehydrogenase